MAERKRLRSLSTTDDDGLRDSDMYDETVLVWGNVGEIQKAYQRQQKEYEKIQT